MARDTAGEQVDPGLLHSKLSADRMLMAWTNMTVSMIGFGFAIYEVLQGDRVEGVVLPGGNTPRNVGMFLVATGTVGITMGIVSYVRALRRLRARQHFSLAQPALVVALLMSGLGLVLCTIIATKMF